MMSYKRHNFKDGDPLFAAQLNEMDAAIEDLVSRGPSGPISWNDLTDRPFYEEGTGAVIEWDGNTEGRDQVTLNGTPSHWYKVSDLTPTEDELSAFVIEASDGTVYPNELVGSFVGEDMLFAQVFIVFYNTEATLDGALLSVPSPGIYFVCVDGVYIEKFTYGSTTIKKLDEKFIPDTIARVGEVSGGLSPTAVALLIDILRHAACTENVTGKIAALEAALTGSGNPGGGSPDEPVADDIAVDNGVMTISAVGSEITVSDGVMTIL